MRDAVEVSLASPIVALTPLHCNLEFTCPPLLPDLEPDMCCFPYVSSAQHSAWYTEVLSTYLLNDCK